MGIRAFGQGHTDVGSKRTVNEDRFLADNDLQLYMVCDGMGGHAAGDLAAESAVKVVRRELRRRADLIERVQRGVEPPAALETLLVEVIQRACREIFDLSRAKADLGGMGCTLTALLVAGPAAAMGHVGDSRLYLVRDNAVFLLSHDHTMAAEMAREGGLPLTDLKRSRFRSVLTRSVGTHESVQVDTLSLDALPGDGFLLCSDGVGIPFDDISTLREALATIPRHALTEELVRRAVALDGSDNATLVTVWIRSPRPEHEVERATDVERRLGALSRAFLFNGLDLRDLAIVLNACDTTKFPHGARIIEVGQEIGELLIPLYGRFALLRAGAAPLEVGPDVVLGAATLLRPRPARCAVRALEPSRVIRLDRAALHHLARTQPALGVELLNRLALHLSEDLDADAPREGNEARAFQARRML